jgi:hypothetical protein
MPLFNRTDKILIVLAVIGIIYTLVNHIPWNL